KDPPPPPPRPHPPPPTPAPRQQPPKSLRRRRHHGAFPLQPARRTVAERGQSVQQTLPPPARPPQLRR
ncbi:LytR family transcriptional regulator, partial [Neisseria meningitidis]